MKCPRITSTSNPHIKETLNILKKRGRQMPVPILIEGINLIEMALNAGAAVDKVFFTAALAAKEEGRRMLEMLPRKRAGFFEVSDKVMDRLTDTESPQGIIAVVSYRPVQLDEVETSDMPLVTVLDGVRDPGNVGTIIRTSDAAGADAVVILPGTCDPFMPKPLRASAGSVFGIPVVETGPAALMKWLKDRSVGLAVTAADAADTIYDADLTLPVAIAFGNEAHGISGALRESAGLTVSIPIYGGAESLNVGSAAAICLYEAVRQRRAGPRRT